MKEQILAINPKAVVRVFDEKFSGKEFQGGILIMAVDSMKERRKIHDNIEKGEIMPDLIIDGRMGGPQLEIYTFTQFEEWVKTFSDNPSSDPCGARYICYISMVMGALIANQTKRFLKEEKFRKNILFHIDTLQMMLS
jgi:hypothetical protein